MTDLIRSVASVMGGFLAGFTVDNLVPLYLASKKISLGDGGTAVVTLGAVLIVPAALSWSGLLTRLENSGFGLDSSLAAAGMVAGMTNTQSALTQWSSGFVSNIIKYEMQDSHESL